MLKKVRIVFSVLIFGLITFYFLDFAELLPDKFHVLAHIQFVPALMSFGIIALVILTVLTLLLGRIYCSVICPMGILQDIINWISRKTVNKKKRFRFSPAKNLLRWSVLTITVISFLCGFTVLLGLLDPYSAFGRMVTNVFKPVYMAGNNLLESIFSRFGNYTFYQVDASLLSISSFIIGVVTFLVIGYLAWKHGRTWCNTVCPVGTLLGFVSRFSLFKIRIDENKCTHCMICGTKCKASCIDSKNQKIDYTRCVDCFDCLESCKEGALVYSLPSSILKKKQQVTASDASKRRFLLAGITTAVATPKVMAQAQSVLATATGKVSDKRKTPITPPGSISLTHFQAHCTSCHLCVSKCPSHVLKPAFMEYGVGGMMQPTMFFEKGFCNFDCTVCGDVCPNGAIQPLTIEQKHLTQMGRVVFTKENCIVYTDGTSCGACSEHCPTQALSMVPYKDGLTIPHVDTDICVGCGGCEYVCPARPFRAVHIEGNEVQQEAHPFTEIKEEKIEVDDFGF
mgnify:FL=1